MAEKLGLYVHIPFCRSKCDYCDFYSLAGKEGRMDDYQKALLAHMKETAPLTRGWQVDTVYFGGGTPSFYGEKRLREVLKNVAKRFDLAKDAEITVECNPDSVDKKVFQALRRAGVNRISLGVQSAHDCELNCLHRPHTFQQAQRAVAAAREAKIKNISLDLIYGLPNQDMAGWRDTVEQVLELEPEHLSCYGLKVEPGTPLDDRVVRGEKLPDDDQQADMYLWTVERLAAQIEPVYLPERKIHLYHCDHRGLPLALISEDGNTAWSAEYDEWGNQLNEENPHHLHQPYRLPGQQYDKESGLYYNRHRYYDPLQGRYITPDPIGLRGGWNMYQYPLNPIQVIDPMGLDAIENMTSGGLIYAVSGVPGLIAANSITNSAYQFGYDMDAIVGGAHNGAADAMRHCYLMCRMTKTFGSTIADVIGKNHEAAGDRQGQPAKERIMDLKNNTVGIACGDFSAKCSDACIEKYNTGQLFGLDGIKADNPIKAKQGSSDASNY